MKKPFIITIDGPAGSGKSTTARHVAKKLGFMHLDSGAMYRAVTLAVLKYHESCRDELDILAIAEKCRIDLVQKSEDLTILLNDKDVTDEIRTPQVTAAIAPIAANPKVRSVLVKKQRTIAAQKSLVADGRDMGSVVFPNANLKIYMLADLNERAKRRQKDLLQKGIESDFFDLLDQIQARDHSDSHRRHSPLVVPENAVIVDTTKLSIEEQVDLIVSEAKRRGA